MPHPTQMSATDTGLLVIDVQEKLMKLIPGSQRFIANITFLLDAANLLGMTVQATEQYPKGLGTTVPELLPRLPERRDKLAFSSCAVPAGGDTVDRGARLLVGAVGTGTPLCVIKPTPHLPTQEMRVSLPPERVDRRYD